jgi:hypothetical protein
MGPNSYLSLWVTGFQWTQCLLALLAYAVSRNFWNSLSSQHFHPLHMGIKYIRKTEIAARDSEPTLTPSSCQRKSADFHSPLWSVTQFCYNYVISRVGLRNRTHVKLYIGIFYCIRSEELSAITIGGCRYEFVRVTNKKSAISCKIILVKYRIWG